MSLFSNWLTAKAAEELSKRDKRAEAQLKDIRHRIVAKEIINHLIIALACVAIILVAHCYGVYEHGRILP